MAVEHIVTQTFTFPPKKQSDVLIVCSFCAVKFCFSSSYTLLGYKIIENQSIYLISNSLLIRNSYHELFKRLNDFFFGFQKLFKCEKLFFNLIFCASYKHIFLNRDAIKQITLWIVFIHFNECRHFDY